MSERRSKTGKRASDITLEAVRQGAVQPDDIKISPEVLQLQADVANTAGRPQLAENFVRAAELVNVPDDVILRMYNQLRPNRSTKRELVELAKELRVTYNAVKCAELVEDALAKYEKRGILIEDNRGS